jgi:hypothetical protein
MRVRQSPLDSVSADTVHAIQMAFATRLDFLKARLDGARSEDWAKFYQTELSKLQKAADEMGVVI